MIIPLLKREALDVYVYNVYICKITVFVQGPWLFWYILYYITNKLSMYNQRGIMTWKFYSTWTSEKKLKYFWEFGIDFKKCIFWIVGFRKQIV